MDTKELRIGNYIKSDDDIICIVSRIESKDYTNWNSGDCFSITALELNTKDDYLNVKNDKWQPIPLTEGILLKCGFTENKFSHIYEDDTRVSVYVNDNFFFCQIDNVVINHIKHLHQLQNIYFELTNTELKFNL